MPAYMPIDGNDEKYAPEGVIMIADYASKSVRFI